MSSPAQIDPLSAGLAVSRTLAELPGPRGIPVLGNLFQIDRLKFHQIAEDWRAQYGNLYKIRLGNRPVLVVGDAETIGKVLRERPMPFGRGVKLEKIAAEMGITGLFTSNFEAWQRQRPMVMSAFAPNHIKRYFPALVGVTGRLAKRWRIAQAQDTSIDLQADLMRYTVDVTAGLAFGATVNTLESDDDVIQNHLNAIFPMLGRRMLAPLPYWRWFKLARDRELEKHLVEIHRAVEEFIAQARQRMRANPSLNENPGNLIEAMIAARDTPGSQLDDADVAGNVLTMLLAGEDTTANTLAWMIHLIGARPDVQERLAEESLRVQGSAAVPEEFAQVAELVYAEACAHEAMRLKPVAPFLILEAYANAEVAGVRLPEGSLVMLLMRSAAIDATHFPEPLEFRPERWLDEGLAGGRGSAPKRVSMPFGGGPRLCPGRYLALLEIKMVAAMLFRNFRLARVGTEEGTPVAERLSFTMEPVGLRMRLAMREGAPAFAAP
jgi:cytochrome P450